jgi:hypothetical protein
MITSEYNRDRKNHHQFNAFPLSWVVSFSYYLSIKTKARDKSPHIIFPLFFFLSTWDIFPYLELNFFIIIILWCCSFFGIKLCGLLCLPWPGDHAVSEKKNVVQLMFGFLKLN